MKPTQAVALHFEAFAVSHAPSAIKCILSRVQVAPTSKEGDQARC